MERVEIFATKLHKLFRNFATKSIVMCETCSCHHHHHTCGEQGRHGHSGLLFPLLSAALLIVGLVLDHFLLIPSGLRLIYYGVSFLPVGLPILKEAWHEILEKEIFNEFLLMIIATAGAFYIGEYPEAVGVMLFYAIGEWFQERAADKARNSIKSLVDLRPDMVTLVREDEISRITPQEVEVGAVIEVVSGERISLDGTLINDVATFDTAALTGESEPRTINKGEEVLAGMIPNGTAVRLNVLRPVQESALERILKLVNEANSRKAPAERFIRRFAKIYTPIVILLAFFVALLPPLLLNNAAFEDYLYRACIFLVISCPCALVVSIPLSYYAGIGASSKRGILFKGGNYLDAITKIKAVIFDKTGTLTIGKFEVDKVTIEDEAVLAIVGGMEAKSTHPIARAITNYLQERLTFAPMAAIEESAGFGLRADVDGHIYKVGNARFVDVPVGEVSEDFTQVFVAVDDVYLGYIALADKPKEDAKSGIQALRRLGIKTIGILSGDKESIVARLGKALQADVCAGALLPEGKADYMTRFKKTTDSQTAFVGDGINDAPVLALSDLGIAMGGSGSDAAIETADVVIRSDKPSKVAEAIQLGRQTRRLAILNIMLALGAKLIVLILGAFGYVTLWLAVFADTGVALLCIANVVWTQYRMCRPIHQDKK